MEQVKQSLIEIESVDETISYYSVQIMNVTLSYFQEFEFEPQNQYLLVGGEHNILANRFYDC